jgi:flagellar basal body-associated protein FliL
MRTLPPYVFVLLCGSFSALTSVGHSEEIKKDATTTPAPSAITTSLPPDPTAAIVAEGKYIYRQRDVDALVLIATRHAKLKFSKSDEEALRQTIVNLLIAREPLKETMAGLPVAFTSTARDMFIGDVLAYEAELSPINNAPPAAQQNTQPNPSPNTAVMTSPTNSTPKSSENTTSSANPSSSLLIRLPPLRVTRTLPALGKRSLSLTIALFFTERAAADKLQDRAPLIQDAILSYIQTLPPAQFAEPNQLTLKDGISAAIIAKVPEFPSNAVLIPEMDASTGE